MKQVSLTFLRFTLLAVASLLFPGLIAKAQDIKTPFFRGAKAEVMIGRPSKTKGGDFDDQMQVIKPRIKFTNTDNVQNYSSHKASFMLIGESAVDGKVFKVLLRHDFNVDLPARQIAEQAAPDVTTKYDTTGAKFGWMYDGWILIVKDPQGQLVMAKSSLPSFEKMPTQLDSLKQNSCYNRQLKLMPDPDRN